MYSKVAMLNSKTEGCFFACYVLLLLFYLYHSVSYNWAGDDFSLRWLYPFLPADV